MRTVLCGSVLLYIPGNIYFKHHKDTTASCDANDGFALLTLVTPFQDTNELYRILHYIALLERHLEIWYTLQLQTFL